MLFWPTPFLIEGLEFIEESSKARIPRLLEILITFEVEGRCKVCIGADSLTETYRCSSPQQLRQPIDGLNASTPATTSLPTINHNIYLCRPPAAAMQGWLNKQSHGVIKKSQRHWFELWGPELR